MDALPKNVFNPTPHHSTFSSEQQKIIKYWNQNKLFQKQMQLTKKLTPFVVYDGPPFPSGLPHIGHICIGTIKDIVCRYATQTQHFVKRRFGWDCHGLAIQYEVNRSLEIKSKMQVQHQIGIKKYNQKCRQLIFRNCIQWQHMLSRFGQLIDFQQSYKTHDIDYMESVWYVFKTLFIKGLVYKQTKVLPYSNCLQTIVSNFQAKLNYKQIQDLTYWVLFPLASDPKVKFVCYTTNAWTLPSNLWLAVDPEAEYVKISDLKTNEIFILSKCSLDTLYKQNKKGEQPKPFQIIQIFKGKILKGIQYTPLFQFFEDRKNFGYFNVILSDLVDTKQGSGIIHCAPWFDENAYQICKKQNLQNFESIQLPINDQGKFRQKIFKYTGLFVKDAEKFIIKDLQKNGKIICIQQHRKNQPFCWRSDTPLINKLSSSWFVKVADLKEKILQNNMKSTWNCQSFQNRFNSYIKDCQDWSISRTRFWGTPIPLWISDDEEQIICIGSLKQLQQLTGEKINDMHRENIDHLTIQSKKGKGKLKRVKEVFDCWFESGSIPFAHLHNPFSPNKLDFAKNITADFVCEGLDQIIGWFYTVNVIAAGIKGVNPFKNLIASGLVLNMSKRLRNYSNPLQICQKYGADAIRMYLINSGLPKGQYLNFSQFNVKEVTNQILVPWYNLYKFLIQNISQLEGETKKIFKYQQDIEKDSENFTLIDKWIQSALQGLIIHVTEQMNQYQLNTALSALIKFLDSLINWYIRFNRKRLQGRDGVKKMQVSINVFFDVLLKVNILMSCFVPFITESMYLNMKKCITQNSIFYQDSIHFLTIPKPLQKLKKQDLHKWMDITRGIVETACKLRDKKGISINEQINSLTIISQSEDMEAGLYEFLPYVKQQLRVSNILIQKNIQKYISLSCIANLRVLGQKLKGNKLLKYIKIGINQLPSDLIKEIRWKDKILIAGFQISPKEDIIIKKQFILQNVREYEIIGGEQVIVLLDCRQSEQQTPKRFVKQLMSKIQDLREKAHIKLEQNIFVFYEVSGNEDNLPKDLQFQLKTMQKMVKRPIFPYMPRQIFSRITQHIDRMYGYNYKILLTYPHLLLDERVMNEFGKKGKVIKLAIMGIPYQKIKYEKEIKIKLDGKEYELFVNKHYKNYHSFVSYI